MLAGLESLGPYSTPLPEGEGSRVSDGVRVKIAWMVLVISTKTIAPLIIEYGNSVPHLVAPYRDRRATKI